PVRGVDLDASLAASDRRVGTLLYRPSCPECSACEAIRVPVRAFRPRRDQRRTWARCAGAVQVTLHVPSCTPEHLDLFRRHKAERGLEEPLAAPASEAGYVRWLVHTCTDTVEMRYTLDDRLVGVGILDIGATAASSVYFTWDPDCAHLGLGVYSVLHEIAWCRARGLDWLYLGLAVQGCPAMAYKTAYRPHERLVGGVWKAVP
ncbi:MAG: arginyltransferase, partial [Deltaproteobacteria bacterium]|nr:arginyltransferase [Deltaproteobacteria bacterium]